MYPGISTVAQGIGRAPSPTPGHLRNIVVLCSDQHWVLQVPMSIILKPETLYQGTGTVPELWCENRFVHTCAHRESCFAWDQV